MDGIGVGWRKGRDWVWLALALMLAVTPVVAAESDQDKYAPQTVAAAERRLSSAGQTLGAASMCKDIDRARIRAATLKVNELIDRGVDNNRQYYAGKNIVAKGMDEGKDAIKRGHTDCRRAESDLTTLEEQLGR
jgi:hypothetical protein